MSAVSTTCVLLSLCFSVSRCDVLLWGHERLATVAPGPFAYFDNGYLDLIVDVIKPQRVIAFVNDNDDNNNVVARLTNRNMPKFKQLVEDSLAAVYVPKNSKINSANFTTVHLSGSDEDIDEKLSSTYRSFVSSHGHGKILAFFVSNTHRIERRSIDDSDDSDEKRGPSLYYVENKAILFSSVYPLLTIRENDTDTEYELRKATYETADVRGPVTRLIVTFSLEEGSKVVLRFRFVYAAGYWSLNTLELQDQTHRDWTLTTDEEIAAQKGFSYHCSGTSVFRNVSAGISLILTNIQAQPAPLQGRRFSDAYDCVNFTTIPIWSGLFVTAILVFALALALSAIADIRTMDRFDDPKGKTLTVPVE